jgi:hypothetical protein
MARSERQGGGTRGGVGTMIRSGARPRPQQAPEGGQAAPDPRRGRQPRPVPPQRPVTDQPAGPAQRPDGSARAAGRRDQRVPPRAAAAKRRGSPQAAAAPAGPGARLRAAAPWRVQPAGRVTGPQQARTTGPQPAVPQAQQAAPAQAGQAAPRSQLRQAAAVAGSHRMPFVLLLCGLLGGALVSALVISTTLAEGSFQINKLQDSTSSLARQRQTLQEQVAQGQSAQVIEQQASKLGMRRPQELQFINLKTGKTANDGPTWIGAKNAPGYAP